jgi:hypothetical protein
MKKMTLRELADNLREAADLDLEMRASRARLEQKARVLAPVKTGRLRSSIRAKKYGALAVRLEARTNYAKWVEYKQRFLQRSLEAEAPVLADRLAKGIARKVTGE